MKNRGKKSKITFDEEVVTKQDAKDIISAENCAKPIKKRKHKNEEKNGANSPQNNQEQEREDQPKLQIKKKRKQLTEPSKVEPNQEPDTDSGTVKPKTESNRAKKRKKHAELQQKIKLKSEQEMQEKALNYLSKWQHCRQEWKFEKLRQVWLQQNLLDSSKVPEEHWNAAIQYFSGSEGRSRQIVLETCLKLIESDSADDEQQSEEHKVKVKRARDLVQHLH